MPRLSKWVGNGSKDTAMTSRALEAHEDVFGDSGRLFFMMTCHQRDVMCNLASCATPVLQPVGFSSLPLCTDVAKNGWKTPC